MQRTAWTRRRFLQSATLSVAVPINTLAGGRRSLPDNPRPNILWITCEDTSLSLGCYGDQNSATPNLDRLASEGVRFKNAFATAPVCTPARSCIVTGVYAGSQGTLHLRQEVPLSKSITCFPELLRKAGYYCSNNVKQDYNFKTPKKVWDLSSKSAHWRGRKPGQPFFSVFNITLTHQSQVRYEGIQLEKANQDLPEHLRHRPEDLRLPSYYPDTPRVRQNLAAYYVQVSLMDRAAGEILAELDADGLSEDTLVFFYSDHGAGLPRGKRWLMDTGLRVPFLLRVPKKFEKLAPSPPNSTSDRLISFVDLAPTVLSLADLPIPEYMQGKAFLGTREAQPREFVFSARDRVDENVECSRSIRDERFHYIRNFLPHRPRMQHSWYSEITPIRQEIRRLHEAGQLEGTARWFMDMELPPEELYDLSADPEEMRNLAPVAEFETVLSRMRARLKETMLGIRDTGLLTESEMHRRSDGRPPIDAFRTEAAFPVSRLLEAALVVGQGPQNRMKLEELLSDSDSGVRYWAATGLAVLGPDAKASIPSLQKALSDPSPSVQVAAAEALCRAGDLDRGLEVLAGVLAGSDSSVILSASAALLALGKKAAPVEKKIRDALSNLKFPRDSKRNVTGALQHVLSELEGQHDPQKLFDQIMQIL